MLTRTQIDHFPDSNRYTPHINDTFQQRYWFDASYYKNGGPVLLYIGGETAGTNRFENLQTGSIPAVFLLLTKIGTANVVLQSSNY